LLKKPGGLILGPSNGFPVLPVSGASTGRFSLVVPHPGSKASAPLTRDGPRLRRNIMTEKVRKELDALELLMQDHREVESLIREFEYLQQNRRSTGRVIANACAEIQMHDKLQSEIFYAAVGKAAAGSDAELAGLLDKAEVAHDTLLELIEKVQQMPADDNQRDAHFTLLAEHVKHHVLGEETELFPLVKKLKRLDLDSIAAAMKKRQAELIAEMGISEADAETV
jgi:hypothetical protein